MNRLLFKFQLLVNKSSILVGGQAVMEGVMMRVPGAYATAVRDSKGNIQTDRHEFKSITEIYPLLNKPLLRGIIGLFESLKIGNFGEYPAIIIPHIRLVYNPVNTVILLQSFDL